jgi:hypothetical protein
MLRVMIAALGFSLGTTVVRALEWENLTAETSAFEGDSEAKALFHYRNTAKSSVTITSVDASCGCTDAEVQKKVVGPGESGVVTATLQIGSRVGRQEKWITVTTDESPDSPVTLTLVVTIKETAHCEPRLLLWSKGQPPAAQSTDIVAAEGEVIDGVEASSDNARVAVSVAAVEPGRRYRVTVTPSSTSVSVVAEIPCTVRIRGHSNPPLRIYASVR